MYAQDSIELLQKSGIDFKRLETEGIDNDVFAEHLITSGLVLFSNVKWVSFHSLVPPPSVSAFRTIVDVVLALLKMQRIRLWLPPEIAHRIASTTRRIRVL
jgi:hypothetical protein